MERRLQKSKKFTFPHPKEAFGEKNCGKPCGKCVKLGKIKRRAAWLWCGKRKKRHFFCLWAVAFLGRPFPNGEKRFFAAG